MPILFHLFLIILHSYVVLTQPAYAATMPKPANIIGSDISYPQCGKSFPAHPAFAIIGINSGRASTTNPCLANQLAWASNTPGTFTQPGIQFYVNTSNPGQEASLTWPSNNLDSLQNLTINPYGNCNGSNTTSCAWQYGWNRAMEDIIYRFIPAAQTAGINTNPASYHWWLDVETTNSWQNGSTALINNTATLEGMVAHFHSIGATVGLYSTNYQWSQIVGTTNPSSNLNHLPNWLPGAENPDQAKANCHKPALTPGSHVTLTQYTDQFDHDYACP